MNDVTMTPKHIDPSCGIRSTFLSRGVKKNKERKEDVPGTEKPIKDIDLATGL